MKKHLISKLIILTLTCSITTAVIAPGTIAIADTVHIEQNAMTEIKDIKKIDENTVEVDGVRYNLLDIANYIKASLNDDVTKEYNEDLQRAPGSKVTKETLRIAVKWLKENWTKVYDKCPNWLKGYLKFDLFFKAADQFIGISDTIEDLIKSAFRYIGVPETANWAITNIIMILLPI
ncbi:hypothetical protein [Clostridium hydrogeniformans]|uniref:hypothetical protein n=1 Tax=Clostridium hydrogeniformans TaxID=349933 RepID=UPI0004814A54|nr:hypothetical protein [Clostridium hydrogeniformans]